MDINAILQYISYAVYAAVIFSFPLRRRRMVRLCGRCLLAFAGIPVRVQYVVLCLAVLLIVLPGFRDFGLFVNCVLYLCAIVGAEVIVRDTLLRRMAGIYEHALIVDGRYLPFDDIRSLPELAYKNDDAEEDELYARVLKIVSEKSGVIYVGFADRAQKKQAVELLLKLLPRLAP